MKYRILIEQDEDGMFVAEVPALPGCISQGKTRHEALDNIKEAIQAYIESLEKHKEIAKGTLRKILRDAGLTVEDFVSLL